MCLEICCNNSQLQCQDIQLQELHTEKMITITQQPINNSNNNNSNSNNNNNITYNPCLRLSLAGRPYSWNCEDDDQYNVDDFETRTPTLWHAWWLKSEERLE
ncbi:hypothetical protein ACLKA7_007297 [Drosophila subpalustris]